MPGLRCETTPTQAEIIEAAVIRKLLEYARGEGQISDPIVRDLLPNEDLKGGGAVGSGQLWQQEISAMSYVTVYSGKNDDDRAFAIYFVQGTLADPLTAKIEFYDGVGRTAKKDIWQVELAWLQKQKKAYCNAQDAIFFGASKGYNIDFTGGTDSGIDGVILGGKVVETRGKTISPK